MLSITKNSIVIARRNGVESQINSQDVIVGDYLKGYDKINKIDCFNEVLEITYPEIEEKDQVRFWYNQTNYNDSFLIVHKLQEVDVWDWDVNDWNYKIASELQNSDIIKGTDKECKVNLTDHNCNEENGFVSFRLGNSHNFYVRKNESEYDPNQKSDSEGGEKSDNTEIKKRIVGGYLKKFEDFILMRSLK